MATDSQERAAVKSNREVQTMKMATEAAAEPNGSNGKPSTRSIHKAAAERMNIRPAMGNRCSLSSARPAK
ncbi:hypothetical protein D3C83_243450 [compost metagenome]